MRELAVDAPPGRKMRELAVDAPPGRKMRELAGIKQPHPVCQVRAFPSAPARADPVARAPHPPAGHLRVVEVGVFQLPAQAFGAIHKPRMAGFQISLDARPVRVVRHGVRVIGHRPPKVRHKPVRVVDRFHLAGVRSAKQHRRRACERLHVIHRIAQRAPHGFARQRLPAKVGERRG